MSEELHIIYSFKSNTEDSSLTVERVQFRQKLRYFVSDLNVPQPITSRNCCLRHFFFINVSARLINYDIFL